MPVGEETEEEGGGEEGSRGWLRLFWVDILTLYIVCPWGLSFCEYMLHSTCEINYSCMKIEKAMTRTHTHKPTRTHLTGMDLAQIRCVTLFIECQ